MPGARALILVVEDEAEINDLIADVLRARNYVVLQARDGVEALRLYRTHAANLSLVLCDLGLPDIHGFNFLRAGLREAKAVPFVVISGTDDVRTQAEAVRLGAVDFVSKPTAMMDLANFIPRWQATARMREG